MNNLPLSSTELHAVALTMDDLKMLPAVEGMPTQPQPIPGREQHCSWAELGTLELFGIAMDDDLTAYLDAHHRYISWHPEQPTGISAHKLVTFGGWVITAIEVRAALRTLANTSSADRTARVQQRFGAAKVDLEKWEDWNKLMSGSADSGYPIYIAPADYDGTLIIAELLLEQQWHTA